eukprot:3590394-Alexandrium_andersonii.AAC.1
MFAPCLRPSTRGVLGRASCKRAPRGEALRQPCGEGVGRCMGRRVVHCKGGSGALFDRRLTYNTQ